METWAAVRGEMLCLAAKGGAPRTITKPEATDIRSLKLDNIARETNERGHHYFDGSVIYTNEVSLNRVD